MKIKKRYVAATLFFLLIIILFVTNPTKNDYLQFSEEQIGIPTPTNVEIEKVNFYLFSTYTPVASRDYGATHF